MPLTETLGDARRILVYGVTGAGKTTLARTLGERTGLPWHSVDDLTFEPGWVTVPLEEQKRRIQAIVDGPEWILDTAYGNWLDIPFARAEVIVGLDYPRWFSLQRLVRRTITRLFDGKPICNGNRETLKEMFSKNSIIGWHFKSFRKKHDRIEKWSNAPDGPKVIRLYRAQEAERLLEGLKK